MQVEAESVQGVRMMRLDIMREMLDETAELDGTVTGPETKPSVVS
jgi:hypothetical protein